MWIRLRDLYSRRIVNVNVNIVLAGLLALVPVLLVIRITEWALRKGFVDNDRLHVSEKVLIGVVTFFADIVFDVAIYYALHWLANHAPWLKRERAEQIEAVADAAVESSPFFRDATKVQLQRMVLSPLLYILWLGTQQTLLHGNHVDSTMWATVWGFCVGVGTARTLHTYWMIQEERARKAAIAAGKPAVPPPASLAHGTKHAIWERHGHTPDTAGNATDGPAPRDAAGRSKGA